MNVRPDALKILTWSLINGMVCILSYYDIACNKKDISSLDIKLKLEAEMQKIEAKTCEKHGWSMNEYYADIECKEKAKDPELLRLLNIIDTLINKASVGEKPVVSFEMAPELTKEVTMQLYKWIMLSNAYVEYESVKGISKIMDNVQRKEDLVRRFNVTIKENENYAITLQRAFFTYRTHDEEFEVKVKEISNLKKILNSILSVHNESNEVVIPEFEKDPFEMGKEEMEALYDKMIKAYVDVSEKESEEESKSEQEDENEVCLKDGEDGTEELIIEFDPNKELTVDGVCSKSA